MTAAPDPTRPGPAPGTPLSDVARGALDARLREVGKRLRRAARHPERDPERVHRLRVAARRAGVAVDAFAPLLPRRRARALAKDLRRIRRAAGGARDLDVLRQRWLARGDGAQAPAWLLTGLDRKRRAAQRPLRELDRALGGPDGWRRRRRALLRRVRWRAGGAEPSFGEWALGWAAGAQRALREAASADLGDLDALHRLRVAVKRARYGLELCASALPDREPTVLLGELEALQAALGDLNDRAVALSTNRAWADTAPDATPSERAALARLAAAEAERLEAAHRALAAGREPHAAQRLAERLGGP